VTDPARVKRSDPGTPEVCNIYHLHRALSDAATVEHVALQCRTAGWGCIDCKKVLHESIEKELTPIRRRAVELAREPEMVDQTLEDGARKAAAVARETMQTCRDLMGFE
jgi:tryptophanyl-tRNA synthetase